MSASSSERASKASAVRPEEVGVPGGAHAFQAFADVGVKLLAVRGGEDILREAAAQGLREIEVHKVAAQGVGGDLTRAEELLVHGVHHGDVGINCPCIAAAARGTFNGQDNGVFAGSHGKSLLQKAGGAQDSFNVRVAGTPQV